MLKCIIYFIGIILLIIIAKSYYFAVSRLNPSMRKATIKPLANRPLFLWGNWMFGTLLVVHANDIVIELPERFSNCFMNHLTLRLQCQSRSFQFHLCTCQPFPYIHACHRNYKGNFYAWSYLLLNIESKCWSFNSRNF